MLRNIGISGNQTNTQPNTLQKDNLTVRLPESTFTSPFRRHNPRWFPRQLARIWLVGSLDTTLIDVMWAKQAPWTQLETSPSKRNDTDTHTHTQKYTHLPLCHWHTLVIVTDTRQHIDRDLYTYMTSYLAQAYRPSIIIDKSTLLSIVDWYDFQLMTVLLINTHSLSIVIDSQSHYQ